MLQNAHLVFDTISWCLLTSEPVNASGPCLVQEHTEIPPSQAL